ncbi:hypothetical protein OBBRIDRAFT_389039 [Obba rivulosa]|uniref:Uncharacterized protein n=1 Tax=Obba rivulosa TaxID=1052685 RepID=A0A8E2ALU0_9APHY|nr:hypothetical protein OBBRIDRAFT_389039 [Obba rivulosa]
MTPQYTGTESYTIINGPEAETGASSSAAASQAKSVASGYRQLHSTPYRTSTAMLDPQQHVRSATETLSPPAWMLTAHMLTLLLWWTPQCLTGARPGMANYMVRMIYSQRRLSTKRGHQQEPRRGRRSREHTSRGTISVRPSPREKLAMPATTRNVTARDPN